jgi:hypothetical protein
MTSFQAKRGVGKSRSTLTIVAVCAVSLSACGLTHNVVVRKRPGADTGAVGALQRCDPGEMPCTIDPNGDTSRFNDSHTTFFSFPDCPFGIEQLLIHDSGSSSAVLIAQCSARPQQTAFRADAGMSEVPRTGDTPAPP